MPELNIEKFLFKRPYIVEIRPFALFKNPFRNEWGIFLEFCFLDCRKLNATPLPLRPETQKGNLIKHIL